MNTCDCKREQALVTHDPDGISMDKKVRRSCSLRYTFPKGWHLDHDLMAESGTDSDHLGDFSSDSENTSDSGSSDDMTADVNTASAQALTN